jgi:hypothetical protein
VTTSKGLRLHAAHEVMNQLSLLKDPNVHELDGLLLEAARREGAGSLPACKHAFDDALLYGEDAGDGVPD